MARKGQVYLNKGVAAFAREHGMSQASVSTALSKGDSFEKIAERVRMRDGLTQRLQKDSAPVSVQPVKREIGQTYISAKETRRRKEREAHAAEYDARNKTLDSRASAGAGVATKQTSSNGVGKIVKTTGRNGHTLESRVVTSDDLVYGLERDEETGETFPQAKIRHEIAKANERELIVAQRRGELAAVARMNQWFGGCIIRSHDRLDRVGPECGDRLAAMTDPSECAKLVNDEIQEALSMLALFSTGVTNGNGVNRATEDRDSDGEDSDSA